MRIILYRRILIIGERAVQLAPTEMKLIRYLLANRPSRDKAEIHCSEITAVPLMELLNRARGKAISADMSFPFSFKNGVFILDPFYTY